MENLIPSELEELIVKSCALRILRESGIEDEELEMEVAEMHALIDPLEAIIIE